MVLALALLGIGIWAYQSLSASGGGGGMPAPAGYTTQQMIFDDQFSGTSLDTAKWNTYLGAQGIVWNDRGRLPSPYSGPNTVTNQADTMFGPSQVSVNDGLTLTAQRNTNRLPVPSHGSAARSRPKESSPCRRAAGTCRRRSRCPT